MWLFLRGWLFSIPTVYITVRISMFGLPSSENGGEKSEIWKCFSQTLINTFLKEQKKSKLVKGLSCKFCNWLKYLITWVTELYSETLSVFRLPDWWLVFEDQQFSEEWQHLLCDLKQCVYILDYYIYNKSHHNTHRFLPLN